MKAWETFKDIWGRLYKLLSKKQRVQFVFLFVAMLVGSAFQTLGVSAIVPLINALLSPKDILENRYIGWLLKKMGACDDHHIILYTALMVVFVYIVKDTYLCVYDWYKSHFEKKLQKDLACRAFRGYVFRPYTFYLDINSAEILRGTDDDVNCTIDLYTYINTIFSEFFTSIMIIAFLIYTDWVMALGVLFVTGVCFFGITKLFRKLLRGIGQTERDAQYEKNKWAYQMSNGIKEIDVMNRKDCFIEHYDEAYERKRKAMTRQAFLGGLPNRIIECVLIVSMMLLICFRTISGNKSNYEFIASLSAFALAAFKIMPSISAIAQNMNSISVCRPSLNACYDNMMESKKYVEEHDNRKEILAQKELSFDNRIQVDNVTWHYPKSEKNIIDKLSLTIKKGQSIGIIGASGAGKTTLSDMILGLYKPQEGDITVDGRSIYSNSCGWSKIVGYVPQNVFLLDDTIRENVLFGEKADHSSDERIWKVLEKAQLRSFVEGLPEKLDTRVGERGVKFSGGQRQRIAVARALYENPELLVMDEATSSLDNDTEKAVMDSIDALKGKFTMIIIAHRLTTIKCCDVVYEIKDGKARERDRNTL